MIQESAMWEKGIFGGGGGGSFEKIKTKNIPGSKKTSWRGLGKLRMKWASTSGATK